MKSYANLSQETVREICNRLGCPACYARSFRLLANQGEIHGEQFAPFFGPLWASA